jgi:hypothetical protein
VAVHRLDRFDPAEAENCSPKPASNRPRGRTWSPSAAEIH